MEEITIEAGMKKDCITQGEADITSKQSEYTRTQRTRQLKDASVPR